MFAVSAAPVPFQSRVRIAYTLPTAGRARLAIYSVDGRRIARLLDEDRPAGAQSIEWDGRDAEGRPAHAGVYFAGFQWGDRRRAIKLVKLN
jgi:flagellar hook assembly protein FlgD